MKLAFQHEYDLFGFFDAAVRNQEANGFRHVEADQEDVKRWHRTDDECNLPAKVRNQQISNAGGNEPADPPKAFEKDNKTAAQMTGRIFTHECGCDGELSAKTEADQKAKYEQRGIVPGQRT